MSPERQLDVNAVVIGKGAAVPAKTILRGAANTVLTQTVVNEEPAFSKVDLGTMVTGTIDLATQVTGVLPIANGGTGQALGVFDTLWLGGTLVAAGGVVFLGLVGEDTNEVNAQWPAPFAGSMLRMYIKTNTGPVGAETFNYRARINGVSVLGGAISITGAATTGNVTGTAAIIAGDLLSVRLITSAGAAVANHQVSLLMRVDG